MSEALGRYAELVRAHAGRSNLVSPADLPRFESRHIDDSLRLLPLVADAPPGPCADVGTGAGLPGIPLAIESPDRLWRLIEPRRRRVAFLEEVVRDLDLGNVEVVPLTAEAAARLPLYHHAHALVVARALAPPAGALELLEPLVRRGGVAAIFLGEGSRLPAEAREWSEGVAIVRVDR